MPRVLQEQKRIYLEYIKHVLLNQFIIKKDVDCNLIYLARDNETNTQVK